MYISTITLLLQLKCCILFLYNHPGTFENRFLNSRKLVGIVTVAVICKCLSPALSWVENSYKSFLLSPFLQITCKVPRTYYKSCLLYTSRCV